MLPPPIRFPAAALLAVLGMSDVTLAPAKEIILDHGKEVLVERNVPMKTRDGVTLNADVFRPNKDGRFPVILERIPYDKRAESFGPRAAANDYVFIVQDTRGRFTSGGDWYPLKHESLDGYDAVEWAATLPYADGRVGMFGMSYSAITQLLAAVATPPHLTCIMPGFIASNPHEQWVYTGGAFGQALNQGWSTALAINVLERRVSATAQPSHWDMQQPLAKYPMLDVGTGAGLCDFYYDWLRHPDYDAYWKQWSIEELYEKITVPALHCGAWYDYFQEGTVRNYAGLKQRAGSERARQEQRLVMMVGGHAGAGPKIGEVDFGASSVVDSWALALRWYDYIIKGVKNGFESEKPVRLFVMGANRWREEEEWPLRRAVATRFLLDSDGKANGLDGDGRLAPARAGAAAADSYTYDPAKPVPTVGGPAFGDAHLKQGPYDQREVERRPDVLVYSTAALAADTEVVGPVALELYASSSAVDTDFTAKLVDVAPDGTALNLMEGILRARYRGGRERAVLLTPGEVTRFDIALGATAHVFQRGHRIRLEVASSNFPRFDRNLNTGASLDAPTAEAVVAQNAVYHDAAHVSALVLPVLP